MQIGNPISKQSVEEINKFQEKLFLELIEYVSKNSAYYSKMKDVLQSVKSISDLSKIPFTTKDILAENNESFLCVKKSKVFDYVTTSGTLGDPVTFYLTQQDVDRLAYNEAVSMECAGANSDDVFQLMTTIDKRFMAGLAYYEGAKKLNAGMVRVGPGAPHLQWDSILRFDPTILICIPSFIPKLIAFAEENHIDFKNSSVKKVVCIGQPIRDTSFQLNELGKKIKEKWDVELISTYASTEMGSAFTECGAHQGGHLNPDLLILEVLDENDNPVQSGESGEVVVTTLGVEGMPLLRYRTGDICHIYYENCSCGRNTPRLGPVVGRKKQMLKFKGTTIFPPVIFNILEEEELISDYIVEVDSDEFGNDAISILLPKEMENKQHLDKIKSSFKSKLRVLPQLKFIKKIDLLALKHNPNQRKPLVFIDNRN